MTRQPYASITTFLTVLFFSAPALAVDFSDLYHQAENFHESLAEAREQATQAAYERDKVFAALLPNVNIDTNIKRREDSKVNGGAIIRTEETRVSTLSITQSLYTGGRAGAQLRIATIAEAAGNIGIHISRETLLFDLAQAWFSVLKAEQDLATVSERLTGMRRQLEAAELRVELGADVRASALRIAAEVAGLEAEKLSAGHQFASARESLSLLSGSEQNVTLGDPPNLAGMTVPTNQAALRNRADLGLLKGEVQAAAFGVRYTTGLFLPFVDLEGNYQTQSQTPSLTFVPDEDASLTLRATWNLYNGGEDKAERARARSAHRQAQLKVDRLQREISIQVGQAQREVDTAIRRVDALDGAHAFAFENHRIVSETYKVGAATYLDVIDASSALGDARRDLVNARHDHSLALLRLAQATGQLVTLVGESVPPLDDPDHWLPR
jgi:outer membrane protein